MSGVWLGRGWRSGHELAASYHTGVSIEQVQALSSLVTARVNVADVTETRLEGRTGGIKAALLVKGDFLMGTDLSLARFEAINPAARTAVLVLPQPRVTSPRIDADRTRLFAVTESGLWQITPDGGQTSAVVINRAYKDAQHYIAEACNDPALSNGSVSVRGATADFAYLDTPRRNASGSRGGPFGEGPKSLSFIVSFIAIAHISS